MKESRQQLGQLDWLEEWAHAVDQRPTDLDIEQVRARFASAGVRELYPAYDWGLHRDYRWTNATGLAAYSPSFGAVDWLEDEPSPVASAAERLCDFVQKFDLLCRYRLAAIDMRLVADTARALRDRDGPARLFERMLETAIVVAYARPYLPSNKAGVGSKWRPTDAYSRELHDRLVGPLRHSYHAHADRTPLRTLTDAAELLGLDGPPSYSESWTPLTDDDLEDIAVLATRQAIRLEEAAIGLSIEVGEDASGPLVLAADDLVGAELDFRDELEDRGPQDDSAS